MSWETFKTPYRAECACGCGYVRKNEIIRDDDWNRCECYDGDFEICCDFCKEHYHIESLGETHYLVPNGDSFDPFTSYFRNGLLPSGWREKNDYVEAIKKKSTQLNWVEEERKKGE